MSVWLALLVIAPTLSQRASMYIRAWLCRRSENSSSKTDSQNSGFHAFEVGKWVATSKYSGWQLFKELQVCGTEEFEMLCVTLQNLLRSVMSAMVTVEKLLCYQDGPLYKIPGKAILHTIDGGKYLAGWRAKEDHPRSSINYMLILMAMQLQLVPDR